MVTRDLLHNFGTIFAVRIHLKMLVEEANLLSQVSSSHTAKICDGVYGPPSPPKTQNTHLNETDFTQI